MRVATHFAVVRAHQLACRGVGQSARTQEGRRAGGQEERKEERKETQRQGMEPSTAAAVPATPTRSAENAASASRSPEQPQASSSPSTAGPASHRLHNALRADGIRRTMDAVRRRSYDSMSPEQYRKILIIYTGGTIGMKPSPRGYVPAPGYFEQHLASSSLYHDPEFRKPRGKVTRTSNGSLLSQSFLVSPPWHGGRRSVYKMLE